MKKLLVLYLSICPTAFSLLAQENGIYLTDKKTNKSTFIKENLRTKVVTLDNVSLVGNLKIVDSTTISIDLINIPLSEITKIRRASMFHAIADPIAVIFGAILVISGGQILAAGGYFADVGYLFILTGASPLIVPFIKNNHNSADYDYHIKILTTKK